MSENASDLVRSVFAKFAEQREVREGEYLGDDGLIYCSKCKTPVQHRVNFNGRDTLVGCICKCRSEELEKEKQRMEDEERIRRIQRLKATGIQEKHLLDWRFEIAEDSKDIRMGKKYVENWTKVRADNLGLLLWGEVGSGKSFVAACIANALLEQGVPVLMTNFSKILNQMGAMYSEERYQYIASFSNFPLLIIDDLGIERSTEYALEQVYAVIDERYKSGLPVIITTNLTIAELRNPADVPHARIYSRILEMCTPVNISGGDRRKAISQSKRDTVKEVLEL